MSRRMLFRASGLVLAGVALFVLWPRTSQVTPENLTLIREGMTRAEVEKVLGGPPGDYRTGPTLEDPDNPRCCGLIDPQASAVERLSGIDRYARLDPDHIRDQGDWFGDDGFISVLFTRGVVEEKYFIRTEMRQQNPLANLLWRVKRQWRKLASE